MDAVAAVTLGAAGALAGVPVAAVAFSVEATGPIQLPRHWWTGAPARPASVAATSAATGITAAVPGAVIAISPALVSFWLFAVGGIGLAIIDGRRRRLPHLLTGTLVATALLGFTLTALLQNDAVRLLWAVGTGIGTAALLFAVALALPGQIGLGDVAFAGATAFTLGWLSWQAAAFGLAVGLGLQTIMIATRRCASPDEAYPLGPALLAGWVVAVALAGPRS